MEGCYLKNLRLLVGGGILLLLVSGLVILLANNKAVNNNVDRSQAMFDEVDDILIYGEGYFNISTIVGQKALISIPVFDFTDNNELANARISVENFNIGTVDEVDLQSEIATPHYGSYNIEILFSLRNVGRYSLEDVEIVIDSPTHRYREPLGQIDIEVLPAINNNGVDALGSVMTKTYQNQPQYEYSHKVKLMKEVKLKRISLIENDKIKFLSNNVDYKEDNKGFIRIQNDVHLGEFRNVIIAPQLVYEYEGEDYTVPLSNNVFRPTFTDSELKSLLIEKGMLDSD